MTETRTPYHAGDHSPELEASIVQVITFADGSRIRLVVEAPKGETGLSLAHLGYYRHLFKPLEAIRGGER